MGSDIYPCPFLEWQSKAVTLNILINVAQNSTPIYTPYQCIDTFRSVICTNFKASHFGGKNASNFKKIKCFFYVFHSGADVGKHSPSQVRFSRPPVLYLVGGERFGRSSTQSLAAPTELHRWPLEHSIPICLHAICGCLVFSGRANV